MLGLEGCVPVGYDTVFVSCLIPTFRNNVVSSSSSVEGSLNASITSTHEDRNKCCLAISGSHCPQTCPYSPEEGYPQIHRNRSFRIPTIET
jgi:hypothetical protein